MSYLRDLATDGISSRFALLTYPDPITHWNWVNRYPNAPAKDRVFHLAEISPIPISSITELKKMTSRIILIFASPQMPRTSSKGG